MALVLAPHPVRDHASRVTRAGSVLGDATNVHRRSRSSPSTKHYNPLFSLSSSPSKAPPTISLSATCASSSRALLPSPSDLPDVRSVIPFPSSSADDVPGITDIVMLDGTIDSVDPLSLSSASFLPCNDNTSPCSAQTRLRKRRSQAIATLSSQPKGPRRDKNAKSKENSTTPDAVTRKRSRKSWRQIADLMFLATVHRSLVSRLCDSGACGSQVEGNPVDAQSLEGQDVLLARRIQTRLVDHYGCSLELDSVPVALHDNDVHHSRHDSYRSLHPDAIQLPTPPPPPPPPSCPRSSPPPTSDPTPLILTIPQLVATLTMRNNDRCTTRSRSSWRARRAELSSGRSIERRSPLSAVAYASCN